MALHQTLQRIKSASRAKNPAEVAAVMTRAAEQLHDSGILEQTLATGKPAPRFELPDSLGINYNSIELLAKGPLILQFYRGSW